jgi:DNA-directed RNA polymerase alpha subunit
LLATKNFGQTSLNEIKQKLGEIGLSLKAND